MFFSYFWGGPIFLIRGSFKKYPTYVHKRKKLFTNLILWESTASFLRMRRNSKTDARQVPLMKDKVQTYSTRLLDYRPYSICRRASSSTTA